MKKTTTKLIDHLKTPIGKLAIVTDEGGRLHVVGFTSGHARIEVVMGGCRVRDTGRVCTSGREICDMRRGNGFVLQQDRNPVVNSIGEGTAGALA